MEILLFCKYLHFCYIDVKYSLYEKTLIEERLFEKEKALYQYH